MVMEVQLTPGRDESSFTSLLNVKSQTHCCTISCSSVVWFEKPNERRKQIGELLYKIAIEFGRDLEEDGDEGVEGSKGDGPCTEEF